MDYLSAFCSKRNSSQRQAVPEGSRRRSVSLPAASSSTPPEQKLRKRRRHSVSLRFRKCWLSSFSSCLRPTNEFFYLPPNPHPRLTTLQGLLPAVEMYPNTAPYSIRYECQKSMGDYYCSSYDTGGVQEYPGCCCQWVTSPHHLYREENLRGPSPHHLYREENLRGPSPYLADHYLPSLYPSEQTGQRRREDRRGRRKRRKDRSRKKLECHGLVAEFEISSRRPSLETLESFLERYEDYSHPSDLHRSKNADTSSQDGTHQRPPLSISDALRSFALPHIGGVGPFLKTLGEKTTFFSTNLNPSELSTMPSMDESRSDVEDEPSCPGRDTTEEKNGGCWSGGESFLSFPSIDFQHWRLPSLVPSSVFAVSSSPNIISAVEGKEEDVGEEEEEQTPSQWRRSSLKRDWGSWPRFTAGGQHPPGALTILESELNQMEFSESDFQSDGDDDLS